MKIAAIYCALATSLVGCAGEKTSDFKPIENGFGYISHVRGFTDRSLSAGLWYRDSDGKQTVVWPHLKLINSDNPIIKNKIAILVGDKAELYSDGVERLMQKLIAFEAPSGPPMDITGQIFHKYCAESSVNITNILNDSFVSLVKTSDGLHIFFGVLSRNVRGPGDYMAEDASVTISWHDIEAIMADVKKTGKVKKEKWSGMEYLQKD